MHFVVIVRAILMNSDILGILTPNFSKEGHFSDCKGAMIIRIPSDGMTALEIVLLMCCFLCTRAYKPQNIIFYDLTICTKARSFFYINFYDSSMYVLVLYRANSFLKSTVCDALCSIYILLLIYFSKENIQKS